MGGPRITPRHTKLGREAVSDQLADRLVSTRVSKRVSSRVGKKAGKLLGKLVGKLVGKPVSKLAGKLVSNRGPVTAHAGPPEYLSHPTLAPAAESDRAGRRSWPPCSVGRELLLAPIWGTIRQDTFAVPL